MYRTSLSNSLNFAEPCSPLPFVLIRLYLVMSHDINYVFIYYVFI